MKSPKTARVTKFRVLRQAFFCPESFPAEKPEGGFRAFCFGGSTVQGRPYAIETSFTTWLELNLRAADPDRHWQVVNCGGVSYASYRLLPILQEALDYEPDLFIIYTGHNEFLEERSYGQIKHQPQWIKAIHEQAARWRIYGTAKRLLNPAQPPGTTPSVQRSDLPQEVDALLDYEGGLTKYHRDDVWHAGVEAHYETNLRRMIHIARDAGVPVLLVNPVSNIRDTAPFKVEIDTRLSSADQARFKKCWEEAKQCSWDDLDAKLATTQRALKLDPRHAEAWFLLAKILDAMGHIDEATEAYQKAKDEDICPLRMTEAMHRSVRLVAAQTSTRLVDVRHQFEEQAEHGLPGDDELIDHVHPHIDGHQRIAELLFQTMRDESLAPQPGVDFRSRLDQLYRDNYALLPDDYFPKAMSRLEGLNNWARGRVMRLRTPEDKGGTAAPNRSSK